MKRYSFPPETFDMIIDEVLSGLPEGYTFTREPGYRVRYIVSYDGESLLQITAGKLAHFGGGKFFGVHSLILKRVALRLEDRTPQEQDLITRAGAIMKLLDERLEYYADWWDSHTTPLQEPNQAPGELFEERHFLGTPYDFGGAVNDFTDWYYSQEETYTACEIIPQQVNVTPDMPDCAVEITDGEAFFWVVARRLPDGGSKLVTTGDGQQHSSPLKLALHQLFQYLEFWGHFEEEKAYTVKQVAKTRGERVLSFTLPDAKRVAFLKNLRSHLLEKHDWNEHTDVETLRVFAPNYQERGAFDFMGTRVSWEPGLELCTVTVWRLPEAELPEIVEGQLSELLAWLPRWGALAPVGNGEGQATDTEREGKKRDINAKRRQTVAKLWNQGLGYQEIAAKIPCSVSTVKRDARALGLVKPRK